MFCLADCKAGIRLDRIAVKSIAMKTDAKLDSEIPDLDTANEGIMDVLNVAQSAG